MDVIRNSLQLEAWLGTGAKATFLGLDLTARSGDFAALSLEGCFFLGCKLDETLALQCHRQGAGILAELGLLPAALPAFGTGIYTVGDLYAGLHPDGSNWEATPDYAGYDWFMEARSKPRALGLAQALSARLHDSVQERDVIAFLSGRNVVAIMGGHDFPRQPSPADIAAGKPDVYWDCVAIAKALSEAGFLIMTGGGPGLMEAANLGALLAGHDAAMVAEVRALLPNAPFHSSEWRASGLAARQAILKGHAPAPMQQSLGIPTWFYGHEPPNMFASHHAKMFHNSLREDGLVTWANSGIIYFEGNGGTVQEIFQDAAQNYYPTPGTVPTPMIFYNSNGFWERPCNDLSAPGDKSDRRKPLMPLITELANEASFHGSVFLTDDPDEVVRILIAALTPAPRAADITMQNPQ